MIAAKNTNVYIPPSHKKKEKIIKVKDAKNQSVQYIIYFKIEINKIRVKSKKRTI